MALISVHDFVTLSIDNLKNIGSPSYANLPNVDTFRHTMLKKSHLPVLLIRKVFMYREAIKLAVTDISFPIFLFYLRA